MMHHNYALLFRLLTGGGCSCCKEEKYWLPEAIQCYSYLIKRLQNLSAKFKSSMFRSIIMDIVKR